YFFCFLGQQTVGFIVGGSHSKGVYVVGNSGITLHVGGSVCLVVDDTREEHHWCVRAMQSRYQCQAAHSYCFGCQEYSVSLIACIVCKHNIVTAICRDHSYIAKSRAHVCVLTV